jgi:hypothetical protein
MDQFDVFQFTAAKGDRFTLQIHNPSGADGVLISLVADEDFQSLQTAIASSSQPKGAGTDMVRLTPTLTEWNITIPHNDTWRIVSLHGFGLVISIQ